MFHWCGLTVRRLFSSHRVELLSFQVAEEEEEKGVEESPPWDVFKDFSTSLFLLSRYSTWFYNHASRLRPSVETWQFDTLTLRAVGADSSGATTTQETSNSLQTKAKAPRYSSVCYSRRRRSRSRPPSLCGTESIRSANHSPMLFLLSLPPLFFLQTNKQQNKPEIRRKRLTVNLLLLNNFAFLFSIRGTGVT